MSVVVRRRQTALLYGGLLAFTAMAWLWAAATFHGHPGLLGVALVAYTFGLRHAVDADHIAAIDNVTRKLMQAGQRPIAVGLFFSLGHASVVLLATLALAGAARATRLYLERFADGIATVGTVVSVALLLLVALMNVSILRQTLQARRARPHAQHLPPDAESGSGGGFLARACRPLFALVSRSWHMCLIGFLFGLGFDTATEVGVLGLSAAQAAQGLPTGSILVFPVLFAAGMSLLDTLDSTLMVRAYGWAFVDPQRKASYNVVMLVLSVTVALVIGGAEALGLLGVRMHGGGPLQSALAALSEASGTAGCAIIGVFLACWLIAVALQRRRRLAPPLGG